jgi:hypothetical protein
MKKVIYIHGWGSSGTSETAMLLKSLIPGLITPTIDWFKPTEMLAEMLALIDEDPSDDVYIIASSLGGYLAEKIANMRVVHVIFYNPSLYPVAERIGDSAHKLLKELPLPVSPGTASTRSVLLCGDDQVVRPEGAAAYFCDYDVKWILGGHRMTTDNAAVIVKMLNTKLHTLT